MTAATGAGERRVCLGVLPVKVKANGGTRIVDTTHVCLWWKLRVSFKLLWLCSSTEAVRSMCAFWAWAHCELWVFGVLRGNKDRYYGTDTSRQIETTGVKFLAKAGTDLACVQYRFYKSHCIFKSQYSLLWTVRGLKCLHRWPQIQRQHRLSLKTI